MGFWLFLGEKPYLGRRVFFAGDLQRLRFRDTISPQRGSGSGISRKRLLIILSPHFFQPVIEDLVPCPKSKRFPASAMT